MVFIVCGVVAALLATTFIYIIGLTTEVEKEHRQ